MARCIAHVDLDAFYAAVEALERPELRGKPVIVGAPPDRRGVVATASYEARKYGVRSAMPSRTAARLCPDAVFIQPNFPLYRRYSRRVMDLMREVTPLIEQVSIDEAYLDLTEAAGGDFERAIALARDIQRRVKDETGLDCSIGLATNKLVAKIACGRGKPHGFTVVRPGEEAAFLAPLPVEEVPGIGPVTAATLERSGIHTLGQLAACDEQELAQRFGKRGPWMRRAALGIDESPVVTGWEPRSVSSETTFESDVSDARALRETLRRLAADVARRMQREGVRGRTVAIKIRYGNFETITRARTRPWAAGDADEIAREAIALFDLHWQPGRPVRLLGVKVDHLTREGGEAEQARLL
ncbi:MAG TPA: DNA polymerase IV [Dehalococcoidia bacterium]|nr:DNA polymerase IV [Dehalococcoidia bacterium]